MVSIGDLIPYAERKERKKEYVTIATLTVNEYNLNYAPIAELEYAQSLSLWV